MACLALGRSCISLHEEKLFAACFMDLFVTPKRFGGGGVGYVGV